MSAPEKILPIPIEDVARSIGIDPKKINIIGAYQKAIEIENDRKYCRMLGLPMPGTVGELSDDQLRRVYRYVLEELSGRH